MSQLILDVPDDSLLSLKLSDEAAAAEIRLAASVKLYELGRLSSGAAARLAGIPRTLFLSKLADYGVDTFRLTDDEGSDLPWDGTTFGRLKVKGPAVAKAYFRRENEPILDERGFFDTGDVATIDARESDFMRELFGVTAATRAPPSPRCPPRRGRCMGCRSPSTTS